MIFKWLALVKAHIFMSIRRTGFFVCLIGVYGYVILNFLFFCLSNWGKNVNDTIAWYETFAFSDKAEYWEYFILLIPSLCAFLIGDSLREIRDKTIVFFFVSRIDKRKYRKLVTITNALLSFLVFESASLLSVLLSVITFKDTGITCDGIKYSFSYFMNLSGKYRYLFGNCYTETPLIYILAVSVVFSLFIALLTCCISAVIYRYKLWGKWAVVFSCCLTLIFYELYAFLKGDIWRAVSASKISFEDLTVAVFSAAVMIALIIVINGIVGKNEKLEE